MALAALAPSPWTQTCQPISTFPPSVRRMSSTPAPPTPCLGPPPFREIPALPDRHPTPPLAQREPGPSLASQTHCRLTKSSSGWREHQPWVRIVLRVAGMVVQVLQTDLPGLLACGCVLALTTLSCICRAHLIIGRQEGRPSPACSTPSPEVFRELCAPVLTGRGKQAQCLHDRQAAPLTLAWGARWRHLDGCPRLRGS